MKTYVCLKCGNRMEVADKPEWCPDCGIAEGVHVLDGIILGGGCYAIWRDGREVWSGTGLEAVSLLADHLQFGG